MSEIIDSKHTITLTYDQVCILRTLIKNQLVEDYEVIRRINNMYGDGSAGSYAIRFLIDPVEDKAKILEMLDAICDEVEPEARIHAEEMDDC